MSETYVVAKRCPICHKVTEVVVPVAGYELWQAGSYIQDAFPELSVSDREVLKTGTCDFCWDNLFPEEEDDE